MIGALGEILTGAGYLTGPFVASQVVELSHETPESASDLEVHVFECLEPLRST